MGYKYSYIWFFVAHFIFLGCSNKQEKADPYARMQMEAINLIAQPSFAGDYMFYKLTSGRAVLERYYIDTKQVYFTCDTADFNKLNLGKFVINKDSITRAKEENGVLVLGDMHYNDRGRAFFKMSVSNFKIDSNKVIETKYGNGINYKITLPQILDFTYLRSALGGGAVAISENDIHFINHGSVVAKKGEASLSDLVDQITKGLSTKELKSQKLLDFVTKQIEYNKDEAENGYETIKRPNEVLFTKNSDCSGKTILYASLLQQIDIKWCLFYFEKHVCIGVAGDFRGRDQLKFKLDGMDYYLAEATDPTAILGYDSWHGEMNESNLEYYQTSDKGSDVFDYKTKNKLKFLTGKFTSE